MQVRLSTDWITIWSKPYHFSFVLIKIKEICGHPGLETVTMPSAEGRFE